MLSILSIILLCSSMLVFCGLAVFVSFLILIVAGLCLYFGALLTFCTAGRGLLRVIPYQCLCMQLGHCP